jgi:two-component system osmolarity sensor histidine kinase EnvZ
VKLWPGSLFGRLALVLVGALAVAVVATILLFRQDRAALQVRHFAENRIVQLQSLRSALEGLPPDDRREALQRLSRQYGVRIVAADEREPAGFGPGGWRAGSGMRGPGAGGFGPGREGSGMERFADRDTMGPRPGAGREGDGAADPPTGPLAAFQPVLAQIERRLAEAFGPGTEVRVQPRAQAMWVRLPAGDAAYWIGFPLPPRPQAEGEPTRALAISLAIALALIVAAFLFARHLARPLRELAAAVDRVGRGEAPPPLPESGPSEIAAVNRGFNAMLGNLRRMEKDRAVLLAGVSHDLRTPLARLRLGVELAKADPSTREGMIADIEEMDRVIGQFLDFARGEDGLAMEVRALGGIVAPVVERYRKAGRDVSLAAGHVAPLPVRPTAIARLVANLVDNALAYGAPPVEVALSEQGGEAVIDVADRGPGVAPADVERLKQPFTRADDSRARSDGAAGAGLGLAIVDRIARLHGGRFDLLPREGGGTIARVSLPLRR